MKVCPTPGCPTLIPKRSRHCKPCAAQHERRRGTRQDRGYDAAHDALRRRWAPLVQAGTVTCWRCGEPITPGEPWDLGHTDDRTAHAGPEHANRCNRAAGGRSASR